jgi:CBS domain containing-hemolysin-like protein
MDALLEAGEEEGILEESDRELVRSAVEFGDKIVLEVMTPRPEIFAVPTTLTLREFTSQINEHAFSRVPVYNGSLDNVTGIAFAHDLLKVLDAEAGTRTVAEIQRPAAFVPETKKVAELLREMQREKQHMQIVIDEYGGVAGLVTIEDLLEAIVGNIADEHDEPEADDEPIREPNGAYVVSGSFELSRLRDLFADQFEPATRRAAAGSADSADSEDAGQPHNPADSAEEYDLRDTRDDPTALRLPEHYESTTLGGLVSEIAGHIPLPGEVVEEDGLRLEVLASTDRRIDRIRVSLIAPANQ